MTLTPPEQPKPQEGLAQEKIIVQEDITDQFKNPTQQRG